MDPAQDRADRHLRAMAAVARLCARHPHAAALVAVVAFVLLFPALP